MPPRPSMSWPTATRDLSTAVLAGVALPARCRTGKPAVNAAVLVDKGSFSSSSTSACCPSTMSSTSSAISPPRIAAGGRARRSAPRRHHLRRRMERQELLAAPALLGRSGRRADAPESGHPHQPVFVAVLAWQARHPPRNAGGHCTPRRHSGADVQPGGRQRQPDLRRLVARARMRVAS